MPFYVASSGSGEHSPHAERYRIANVVICSWPITLLDIQTVFKSKVVMLTFSGEAQCVQAFHDLLLAQLTEPYA